MTTVIDEQQVKRREARIRRGLAKDGYILRKSRLRGEPHLDNFGEYMVINTEYNTPSLGFRFDATLGDVDAWMQGAA